MVCSAWGSKVIGSGEIRPRRRAGEQPDELAPFHSITSSARASRMLKPSARDSLALFGPFRNLAGEEYRRAFGVELGLGLIRSSNPKKQGLLKVVAHDLKTDWQRVGRKAAGNDNRWKSRIAEWNGELPASSEVLGGRFQKGSGRRQRGG